MCASGYMVSVSAFLVIPTDICENLIQLLALKGISEDALRLGLRRRLTLIG